MFLWLFSIALLQNWIYGLQSVCERETDVENARQKSA